MIFFVTFAICFTSFIWVSSLSITSQFDFVLYQSPISKKSYDKDTATFWLQNQSKFLLFSLISIGTICRS